MNDVVEELGSADLHAACSWACHGIGGEGADMMAGRLCLVQTKKGGARVCCVVDFGSVEIQRECKST